MTSNWKRFQFLLRRWWAQRCHHPLHPLRSIRNVGAACAGKRVNIHRQRNGHALREVRPCSTQQRALRWMRVPPFAEETDWSPVVCRKKWQVNEQNLHFDVKKLFLKKITRGRHEAVTVPLVWSYQLMLEEPAEPHCKTIGKNYFKNYFRAKL